MNAPQFFQYIEHPDKLGIHEEVQLRGVLKEFPYFQSAHILLAKCLKNMDNYTFEKQLRMAAVFSSNRAVLYRLLKSASKSAEPLPKVSDPETTVSEVSPIMPQQVEDAVLPQAMQPILQSVKEAIEAEELESAEAAQLSHDSSMLSEANASEAPDALEQRRLEISQQYEAFLKRKSAVAGAPLRVETESPSELSAALDIASEPISKFSSDNDKGFESNLTSTAPSQGNLIQQKNSPSDAVASEVKESSSDKPAGAEKRSFSEWLRTISPSGLVTTATKREAPKVVNDTHAEPREPALDKEDIDTILERFIHQNPSISRPKSEFFNPVKAAQKSLEDTADFVTETLARMHEKQGNYQKAIHIYEKLSLKFPEKASIFAALISELKHKIN